MAKRRKPPSAELQARTWAAWLEARPEDVGAPEWVRTDVLGRMADLNSDSELGEFVASPVADRREGIMKATHARLERRDEEVRAIHLERASIEPSCPPPCESFVEAAKERGGRRGYETLRQTVAQAAYGRFDLLFDWLLSHRTPADDEVLADRELGELLAHISEPRRGELLRRLARDIWTRNAPNILTLGRVEYVDAIRRLDAESVAEDAAVRLPPWERLKVIGDNAAELDGTRHRLNGGQAAKMLRLLIDAEGDTVKSSKLGTRPDRVWKKLPEAIQAVVECPDKGRQGYRLR